MTIQDDGLEILVAVTMTAAKDGCIFVSLELVCARAASGEFLPLDDAA